MNEFTSIVLANGTQNLNQFQWEPIYSSDTNRFKHFGFRVLRKLKIRSYPFIYDIAVRKHHPVILHSHFADRGWYDLALAKKYGLKHMVTFYGYDVNMLPTQQPVWKERYKELFEKADLFLCEGHYMAKCIVNLGCPKEKVNVQRLGIEIDKIPFVPRKIGDDGMVRILIAGTFREKKGIPYALEAIGLLKDEYPNIRVTIIGDSGRQKREEEEKSKILNVIKRYNLGPIIRMLGFQPYHVLMEEAYKHHIFLSPSITASDGDTEGGAPVTIIEMAASGMPVISTWHCDIPEVVQDGKTGFLVKEQNINELYKQIKCIIAQTELWEIFGKDARQHTENLYNIVNSVITKEKYYKELL
jgi:colanic acid/amylovoran biosynthesis glycosyltransferase